MAYSQVHSASLCHTYDPPFLYQLNKGVKHHDIYVLQSIKTYPHYSGQTIESYKHVEGWDSLDDAYKKLITDFQTWVQQNYEIGNIDNPQKSSAAVITEQFERFYKKIFGDDDYALNADEFLEVVFGDVITDLCVIYPLLCDEQIPLSIRMETCEDVAYSLNRCIQGLLAGIQSNRLKIEAARLGCSGIIQNLRIEKAKQIALELVRKKIPEEKVTWEQHIVNYLVNYAAAECGLGLPHIKDKYSNDKEVTNIVTRQVTKQYLTALSLHLSPSGIFQQLVSHCLDAYRQALISSNVYPGQIYAESKLPSGQIYEQLSVTTSNIKMLIDGFSLDFKWLLKEIKEEPVKTIEKLVEGEETYYRITLIPLRFHLCQHLHAQLVTQEEGFQSTSLQWLLERKFISQATVSEKKTLNLYENMVFKIEEYRNSRAVNLSDLVRIRLTDFKSQQLFHLFNEAILNTTDLSAIYYFYRKQLNLPEIAEHRQALYSLLIEQINSPEIIAITRSKIHQLIHQIHQIHQRMDSNEYAMLFELRESKALPFSLVVALTEYEHSTSHDPRFTKKLTQPAWLPYVSSDFFKNMGKNALKAMVTSIFQKDLPDTLALLLPYCEGSMGVVAISRKAKCRVNLLQFCIINHTTNKCFKLILQTFQDQERLNEFCALEGSPTTLALAILVNNEFAIEQLIEAGADINKQSPNGYSALHWAAKTKNEAIVKQLFTCCDKYQKTIDEIKDQDEMDQLALLAKGSPKVLKVLFKTLLTRKVIEDRFCIIDDPNHKPEAFPIPATDRDDETLPED